jgi:hypothetical protein
MRIDTDMLPHIFDLCAIRDIASQNHSATLSLGFSGHVQADTDDATRRGE